MSAAMRTARDTLRVVRDEVSARRGWFCLLALLTFAGYAGFIVAMVALRAGTLPNHLRGFRVAEGIAEALTLAMPFRERYALLAEQPLLEFGYLHPLMGSLEGAYTLTLHVLLNLLLVSALIAAYALVMARALRARGLTGRALAGLGLAGGSSTLGVLTAGAATVACCGGPAASVALTLLGAGAGAGVVLAEHDGAFGAFGVLLMLASLGVAARFARAAAGLPGGEVSR